MQRLVLDASVAAKWFLPQTDEPLVEEAFALLKKYTGREVAFLMPDLFWAEFGNILCKAVRLGRCSEDAALASLRAMREFQLTVIASQQLLDDSLQFALSTGRTAYESLYVVLAVQSETQMVTADERLANALGSRWSVRWLGVLY